MLLLIIPLLILFMLAAWLLLLPLSLWQRYRYGRARRKAFSPALSPSYATTTSSA